MKKDIFKIVLLILILVAIPLIIITDNDYQTYVDNYPDLPKDENWEYVKDRISTYYPTANSQLFTGPILLELNNATKKDSLIVNNLLDELKILLPSKKIGFFNTFIQRDSSTFSKDDIIKGYKFSDLKRHVIKLHFYNGNPDIKPYEVKGDTIIIHKDENIYVYGEIPGGTLVRLENGCGISYAYEPYIFNNQKTNPNDISGLKEPEVYFSFNRNISYAKRKEYIEYGFLRKILRIFPPPNNANNSNRIRKNNENSIFYATMYRPENSKFTSSDKFLLQKLYSPNLSKEFKGFMYKTYPWNFASNYLNKEKTKILALWVSITLVILFFILGFSLFYKREYKQHYLNYFIPVLVVLLSALYVYKLYSYMTQPSSFQHWQQYISIHLIIIAVALLIAWVLMLFDKYFVKNDMSFILQIALKTSFTFLIFTTPIIISFITKNNYDVWERLNPYLLLVFLLSLSRGVILYFEYYSDSLIKEKDVELSRLKELNAQNELKSLHAHINPHFLYNALNSIASLVYENPAKTEEMTISLSDLFKYSINRKGEKMSTIANEVEMVENYLKIEKIRFEERLNFTINVEDGLLEKEIPMYVLQPLIENAIKHGISKIDVDGKIKLVLKEENNSLQIIVSDNGPEFPDGLLCGHGLQSVYDILRLSYGDQATMNWENTPEKRIVISITSKH